VIDVYRIIPSFTQKFFHLIEYGQGFQIDYKDVKQNCPILLFCLRRKEEISIDQKVSTLLTLFEVGGI